MTRPDSPAIDARGAADLPAGIGIVTTSRADYGIYRPLLRALAQAGRPARIFAGGAHPLEQFGRTLSEIEVDGFGPIHVVRHAHAGDAPRDVARCCGDAVGAFADAFDQARPELLFVLGDRGEMLCAALAATFFRIPLAHLHGGDRTAGAMDDAFRDALTQLAHLHFPALPAHATRLRALGAPPERIHVVGALAIDALRDFSPEPWDSLAAGLPFDADRPTIVVAYQPETLCDLSPDTAFLTIADGLAPFDGNVLAVGVNADVGHQALARAVAAWAARRPRTHVVASLPQWRFWSWLKIAAALVGNSSSGLIEAPSLGVPVVNVGDRQKGRIRAANVIDARHDATSIAAALRVALGADFRRRAATCENPWGDGRTVQRILDVLRATPSPRVLLERPS